MLNIFWDIIDSLEAFFETPAASLIGFVFLIVTSILILILIKYFENN